MFKEHTNQGMDKSKKTNSSGGKRCHGWFGDFYLRARLMELYSTCHWWTNVKKIIWWSKGSTCVFGSDWYNSRYRITRKPCSVVVWIDPVDENILLLWKVIHNNMSTFTPHELTPLPILCMFSFFLYGTISDNYSTFIIF